MNTLKVGDKVKIRSDLVAWEEYISSKWVVFEWISSRNHFKWQEVVIDRTDVDGTFKFWWYDFWMNDAMLEPIQSSTVKTRPTYQRKAERSDGVVFEKTAIWGRTLKEIEESIKERKDSIKADEQLLRSHRSLFSKK